MNKHYPINHPLLAIGSEVYTYEMGKIVRVRVTEAQPSKWENIYGPEYRGVYIGTETICLDFGQDWWLKPGDAVHFHQCNVDAATKWRCETLANAGLDIDT